MILDVNGYYQLYKLSRLIDLGEFKGIDFTAQTFFQYLMDNWDKDKIKVFVNAENGQINAFAICSLSQDVVTRRPEVFIDLAWVKKGTDGGIGVKLLDKVVSYAKELNLSRISGFTLKGQEKAMFGKYGFRIYSTIMVKDLGQASDRPQNGHKGAKTPPEGHNNVPKGLSSPKEKARGHQRVCKEYYERNKEKIRQKRRERYRMNKMNKTKGNLNKGGHNAEQKEKD